MNKKPRIRKRIMTDQELVMDYHMTREKEARKIMEKRKKLIDKLLK